MTIAKRMVLMAALTGVMGLTAGILMPATAAAHHGGAHWTRLGGDPLVPGGVWTRGGFQKLVTSPKGQRAMFFARLNSAERAAITRQVRMGNFRTCTMRYGEVFVWMSFGRNGTTVDRNVMFLDPRFRRGTSAWCANTTVGGMIVTIKVPKLCGNIAVPRRRPAPKPKPPKPVPPPKMAPIAIIKIAEDASGRQLSAVPTNVFVFDVTCDGHGGPVIYIQTPMPAGTCRVGGTVTITEHSTPGWQLLGPSTQSFQVGSKGVTAVFKNRQLPVAPPPVVPPPPPPVQPPPPPPPPPVNQPPQVSIGQIQHVFVNGQVQICANFSDPDGDVLQVSWSASRGTVSSGRECVTYTAPGTEGADTVTVTVSDGRESRSASTTFNIVKDDFGHFFLKVTKVRNNFDPEVDL
jgi:hypothetical protein